MTFSELKTNFINLADDPAITAVQAGVWVNANYKLLLREYPWSFLNATGSFTVTSGTQEYTFTALSTAVTDFARMIRVFNGDVELSPINYDDRHTAGIVNSYYITPDSLEIGLVETPTNSTDTITFEYEKAVDDMSNDTDVPCFFKDFHYILVWKPLMNYQFQQRESSDEFVQQYNNTFAAMTAWYSMPTQNSVPNFAHRPAGNILPKTIFGR